MTKSQNVYAIMEEELQNGRKTFLLTALDGEKAGALALFDAHGELLWGEGPKNMQILEVPLRKVFAHEGTEYFMEVSEKNPEVLVLGAGHVSRAITDLLEFIGCAVTVADDRPEYLKPSFFSPTVTRTIIDFEHLDKSLPLSIYNGIIVVTRAHEYDSICMLQLREHLDTYIGIMGSTKRIHYAKEALLSEGWTLDEVNKIYGPIGLDLGCDTPEEIALSIVSEYLAVIRKKWPVVSLQQGRIKSITESGDQ